MKSMIPTSPDDTDSIMAMSTTALPDLKNAGTIERAPRRPTPKQRPLLVI